MQQRVSIARAFAFDPKVLLMDEPFSALDEFTREVMRFELLRLWSADYKTVLFVTHSVAEAVLLSDVVVVMSAAPGQIRSVIPVELPRPREEFIDLTMDFRELERQVRMDLKGGWRHGAS
jgi:NitT/TauT family transport system ATP-binding protein